MDNLKYSIENHIVCNKCVEELSNEANPEINLKSYSKFEVGFTSSGLQIWCIRHNINICHVNFGGKKLSADFRCLELKYNKN